MKTRKLIKFFLRVMNQDNAKKKHALKTIINKMKKKESKLTNKLASASSTEDKAEIEAKLRVMQAQRRKGENAIHALNNSDKA